MNKIIEYNNTDTNKLNNDLDIFICTHKDFNHVVNNPCYKVINVKNIDNKELNLKYNDDFYCELISFYWIVKHYNIKKYIGFCHYRRYFEFIDNIPDIDRIFEEYDVIMPTPIKMYMTINKQYGKCHNIDDLNIIQKIINEWYPNYSEITNKVFNDYILFTNNMFIMKRNDFLEFFSFYKNIMDRYLTYIGNDIDKRIEENKSKYFKNFSYAPQNNEVWYQKRIGGYIAERLLTVFVFKKFKNIKTYDIKLTEKKYNNEIIN